MKIKLSTILNRCLIVPLNSQVVQNLEQVCHSYAEDATVDDFENCAKFYLLNVHYSVLSKYIHEKYQETTSQKLKVPYIVNRGLAGYVLSLLLDDDVETLKDELKARIALYVKNIAVCLKTGLYELPATDIVTAFYKYSKEVYNAESELEKPVDMLLYPEIFSVSNFNEVGIEDTNDIYDEVQYLAKKVERFEYNQKLSILPKPKVKTLYVDAYNITKSLSKMSDWTYVDPNPLATIYSLFDKFSKTATLSEIKDKLEETGEVLEYASASDSSVLLRYIKGEKTLADMSGVAFTACEFAAYLYYELLFERLIQNDDE